MVAQAQKYARLRDLICEKTQGGISSSTDARVGAVSGLICGHGGLPLQPPSANGQHLQFQTCSIQDLSIHEAMQ
jgi:hypothetical protein